MQTDSPTTALDTRVAFLAMLDVDTGTDHQGYRGGILVTDEHGKPVEFRATAPVRPNLVQRTLYGQTLLPHIAVELIGLPLLRSLQEKPSVIIIQDAKFFGVRLHCDTPMLRLWRQGEAVTLQVDAGEKPNNEVLRCAAGSFDAIVSESQRQFPGDLESCAARLNEMFATWDLIEPFERIARAVESLHAKKALET